MLPEAQGSDSTDVKEMYIAANKKNNLAIGELHGSFGMFAQLTAFHYKKTTGRFIPAFLPMAIEAGRAQV